MKTKKILLILSICFFAVSLYAEEGEDNQVVNKEREREMPDTLLQIGDMTHSGYGAPLVRFTRIKAEPSVMVGGQGGWIINDQFVIGIGGCGLATMHKKSEILDETDPEDLRFSMGYGGGILEYYFFPKKIIHFSVGTLIGAGGYAFHEKNRHDDDDDDFEDNSESEAFFVLEPAVNMYLNITRFCRFGVGGTYRYVKGMDKFGLKDRDFSDFSGQLMVQFGWF